MDNAIYLMAKPYADYTWAGITDGNDATTNYAWDYWINGSKHTLDYQNQLTFSTAFSIDSVPIFNAVDGLIDDANATWIPYQIRSYYWDHSHYPATLKSETAARILSAENDETATRLLFPDAVDVDVTPLYSSKTMIAPDKNNSYIFTYYSGAQPWGNNDLGWWFGKNGAHIDGIAQAFEKPQHPYTLKNIFLVIATLVANRNVKMTCKVYKLDEIPQFVEDDCAMLPKELGELIATGEATITPNTLEETDGVIKFTLYGMDEYDPSLTYETTPTIDYPILVVVEGYNDEGMEDLVEFSALISSNNTDDEGYGELAYVKKGCTDDDDNFTGEYDWVGLNNFFSVGTMKTGFSIFLGTENNYITFESKSEDGEYLFPSTGGVLRNTWDTTSGIKFKSSWASGVDSWRLFWNGIEEIPDWLTIELNDIQSHSGYEGTVANVYASPLPSDETYREATIRFEIPGDYIDYKFMQGERPAILKGDVNGDHKVSINDVTTLINMLLSGSTVMNESTDVNSDGRITIGDVTELIHNLLSGKVETIVPFENKTFTVNGVKFSMVAVEGGTFAMGATRDQGSNPGYNEKPVHLVTLSDYYVGQTEVTQELWVAVMGSNPSNFKGNLTRPVEMVTWDQCQQFITQLNQITGMNFRMLTEAEWEFAARGGNKSLGCMYSGSNTLDDVAWYSSNAASTTHPVASLAPNELGIYDMSGNVYEYCQDKSSGTANYPSEPQVNPTGPETGNNIIIRGGSIDYVNDYCRNARRWNDLTDAKWKDQGLRLALPK